MTQTRKMLTIPLDTFIQRIAWYIANDRPDEAEALRRLASECNPVYRVDETAVAAQVKELRQRRQTPPKLD